jgi:alkaline phosphatase
MVEWDAHTDNPKAGLERVVVFDKAIREVAARPDMKKTLLLFTADHSFDLRLISGRKDAPLTLPANREKAAAENSPCESTAVTQAKKCSSQPRPGSARVHGYMDNTELFGVMMAAYGWKESK